MPHDYAEMVAVNDDVNTHATYKTDIANYGSTEWWADALEDGKGKADCEDFAIAKMRKLRALGWPLESMKIALCWTVPPAAPSQPDHVVLAVTINGQDWTLDQINPSPVKWQDSPYVFAKLGLMGTKEWRLAANAPDWYKVAT